MNSSSKTQQASIATPTDAVKPTRPSRKKADATPAAPVARKRAAAKPKPAAAPVSVVAEAKPAAAPKRARKAPAKAEPSIDLKVRDAVLARLDAMKANDLRVIDVRGKTSITDCLVIVSGTSTRHVKAMGDEVVVAAKSLGLHPLGVEGEKDAEWMLVDLGDTVVHLMLPKTREFYGLERIWSLAGEARAAASAVA